MKSIKVIFSDIDGTMLKNNYFFKKNIISSKNIQAIEKFVKQNNHIVLASGRDWKRTKQISDYLEKKINAKFIPYLICLNGALIIDNINNKILQNISYNKGVNEILDFFKKKKLSFFLIYKNEKIYIQKDWFSKIIFNFFFKKKYKNPVNIFEDDLDIQKIMVFTIRPNAKKLMTLINEKFNNVYVSCSGNHFLEVIDKNINKFFAIQNVLKLEKNWNIENICTAGNEGNDIKMIEECGFGVAVDFHKNKYLSYDKNKIDLHVTNFRGNAIYKIIKTIQQ